ncbi:hypothetical protein CLF_105267 [Clonorchis sinensis]|uniref:Cilia- and flagella-associated protein 157 n=1 Tax=Clonorchis sinensis TaxID=79923 RepID=G7YP58_CLOSI|nr:hypothetical protein CLF_105267 [Clonorchis sinensis]
MIKPNLQGFGIILKVIHPGVCDLPQALRIRRRWNLEAFQIIDMHLERSGPNTKPCNAIKLSGAPTVHEPPSTEPNDLHYSDQTVVSVNIDVLNTSEETSTPPFSQPYLDGHLMENGPIPKCPVTEPVMARIRHGEQPTGVAQPSQTSVTSTVQALPNAMSSLRIIDPRNGQEDDEPPKKRETDKQKGGFESSEHDVKLADTSLPTDSPSNLTEPVQDGLAEKVQNECQELIVKEYERRVQSLQNHLRTLMEENEEATAEIQTLDRQNRGQLAELKSKLTRRVREVESLSEKLQQKRAMHKREKEKWRSTEKDLEFVKQNTEDQMRAENRILAAEIHLLDAFLANRDAMIHQCQYLEKCLERMELEHRKDLDELTRQNLEERTLLKKNAMKRLEEVASEFRNNAYDQLKPFFRELLQENISIDEGLVQLTGAIQSLTKENAELGVTHRNLQRERRQLGNEHIKLATHSSAVIKLTHLLVVHQNRLDSMSQEQMSDCLSALDSLKGQCTELERQEAKAAESLERTKDDCAVKERQIEMLRKLLEAHISWMADTAKTLSNATELIQNFMCCPTPEETSIEETAKIIDGIIDHLHPALREAPIEDNAAVLDFSWQNNKLEESLSVSEADRDDVVSSDEDKSETSGISEPHGWQIDDTIEVSEPEPASDEELTPTLGSTSAKPLDIKDNVGRLHRFKYLDQIGINLPQLQLNDYCPSSKEWQELLDCFVKHLPGRENFADSATSDNEEDGCLHPGDLYLIPPPKATILTAKEQTHILKRCEVEKLFAPLAEQGAVRKRNIAIQTERVTRAASWDD